MVERRHAARAPRASARAGARGCALAGLVYLLARRRRPTWPRTRTARGCSSSEGLTRLERAVVRRAPRARLLAAVRAAGRGWSARALVGVRRRRRGRARCSCRSRAAPRRRRRRRARGDVAVRRRRALQRRRSGGCRSRSGSRSRSARGRARAAAGAWRSAGVLALAAMLGEPGRGRVPDARRAPRRCSAGGRAGAAQRPRWLAAARARRAAIALVALFPEGGTDRFVATAFWPMLALCAAGVALLAPAPRGSLWAGGLLYLAVLVGAFVLPTPFGQNALRLGVLLGPSLLALAHRTRAPRARARGRRRRAAATCSGCRPCARSPRRTATRRPGWPSRPRRATSSTRVAQAGRARRGAAHRATTGRPPTCAKVVPLARGWERQLDQKANPIFYDGEPLTPARYHAWLRENAVRWVALPNAPLDYSAQRRGAIAARARRAVPRARLRARRDWRIWEVARHRPAGLRRRDAARRRPELVRWSTRPGPTVVRQRYTPYWSATGDALRAPRARRLDARSTPRRRGGAILVQARFGARRGSDAAQAAAADAGAFRPIESRRTTALREPVRTRASIGGLLAARVRRPLLPHGLGRPAAPDRAVLRRLLALPARARAGRRPVAAAFENARD